MSTTAVYEIIGYLASALIVISLAMSSIIRLRVINLVGAITFTIYGLLIGSIPVAVTNVIIAGLDVFYLRRELRTRQELTVVPTERDDGFLGTYLTVFGDDMTSFVQPHETLEQADVFFVMLRDATAAGVFAGRSDGSDLIVVVDYVAPPFRDHKSGSQLYRNAGERFRTSGYQRVVVPVPDSRQTDYLASMGFTPTDDGAMVLSLGS
ncbi:MAG: YgjV family protein [Acidimicrobiia bacterium]|nr:YgjV family protein [Acidimicrobiia bacterium]